MQSTCGLKISFDNFGKFKLDYSSILNYLTGIIEFTIKIIVSLREYSLGIYSDLENNFQKVYKLLQDKHLFL